MQPPGGCTQPDCDANLDRSLAAARKSGDFRAGLHHALYCLGCCWALMVVLIAVGTMNLLAMAALAAAILLEKVWSRSVLFSRAVGVPALVLAVVAVL